MLIGNSLIQYDIDRIGIKNKIGIKYDYLIGLLDRVVDMVFLPNTGSVVVRSSQGRFFFFLSVLAPKRSNFAFFENGRDSH